MNPFQVKMNILNLKPSSVTENLDKIMAVAAGVTAISVVLWIFISQPRTWYRYIESPVLLLIAALVFLTVRRLLSLSNSLSASELDLSHSVHLILDILFFGFFFYSILSIYLNIELYMRPLAYFISTAIATAILAIEILFLPRKKSATGFMLFKIALIALSLRFSVQLIFPELVGTDPWSHSRITQDMLDAEHIIEGQAYSNLPIMHLIIGSTMLITNLSYKLSAMLSIGFFNVSSLIFIFLLGRFVKGVKTGLLAALLLAIASTSIDLGFWIRPISLGVITMPVLIYTLFKARESMSIALVSFAILFSAVLIMTHTVAAMNMAIFLFLFWLGFEIYKAIYKEKFQMPAGLSFSILFVVSMFSWWMYESGHLMTIAQLLERGLRVEIWETSPLASQYIMEYAGLESLVNQLGFTLYLTFSTIGLFYMWSRNAVNRYFFALALGAWGLLGLVFLFPLAGMTGILAGRLYGGLELITAIPLAIGLLWLCKSLKGNLGKSFLLAISISVLCFMSITRPHTNFDNPIYSPNTMSRFAFTESELKAADTVISIRQGVIKSEYITTVRRIPDFNQREAEINEYFISGDYTEIEGLVVIRREIVEGVHNIGGPYRLDHDPRQKLDALNFNRVYNSGTVTAFIKE